MAVESGVADCIALAVGEIVVVGFGVGGKNEQDEMPVKRAIQKTRKIHLDFIPLRKMRIESLTSLSAPLRLSLHNNQVFILSLSYTMSPGPDNGHFLRLGVHSLMG